MLDTLLAYAQDTRTTYTTDIMWIISVVGMWKMFEKAGQPSWAAIIPFYNLYKMCEITMANPWYWLRLFWFVVPVVGWVLGIYYAFQMAKAIALSYGRPDSWAWGYLFLGPIFYCITGFGEAEYYGPMGIGDHRTTDARSAKTVDFDVVKNASSESTDYSSQVKVEPVEPVVEPVREPEEDTVSFNFDEPTE